MLGFVMERREMWFITINDNHPLGGSSWLSNQTGRRIPFHSPLAWIRGMRSFSKGCHSLVTVNLPFARLLYMRTVAIAFSALCICTLHAFVPKTILSLVFGPPNDLATSGNWQISFWTFWTFWGFFAHREEKRPKSWKAHMSSWTFWTF